MRLATLFVVTLAMLLGSCGSEASGSDAKGTKEEVQALLDQLLKDDADRKSITLSLKPTSEDYKAAFTEDVAAKMEAKYESLWSSLKQGIGPNSGQSETLLWSATSEEIQQGSGDADKFPGGYKQVASKLKPGLTWYRFKFVEPGKTLGMAFDGLTFVNGRWVWFPKPWRAL